MSKPELVKVLCVDDEPQVLEGLALHLRRIFDLKTATSGAAGLQIIEQEGPIAVVLSDMRMPEMDGAAFLKQVAERSPQCVRMLLTGQTDMESAILAINEGRIFRFLTKPCPPSVLIQGFSDALEQYRLIVSEKELLNKTLNGSIFLLTEILSLTDSSAFGQSLKIREVARSVAQALGLTSTWDIEISAMLAQIGLVTIPMELREKVKGGETLSAQEAEVWATMPEIGCRLLTHIPRLQSVSSIIRYQHKHFDGGGYPKDSTAGDKIPIGSRILKAVADLTELEAGGLTTYNAFRELQGRAGRYDPAILALLAELALAARPEEQPVETTLGKLRVGDILQGDLKMKDGRLLLASGSRISQTFLERLKHYVILFDIKESVTVKRTDA